MFDVSHKKVHMSFEESTSVFSANIVNGVSNMDKIEKKKHIR